MSRFKSNCKIENLLDLILSLDCEEITFVTLKKKYSMVPLGSIWLFTTVDGFIAIIHWQTVLNKLEWFYNLHWDWLLLFDWLWHCFGLPSFQFNNNNWWFGLIFILYHIELFLYSIGQRTRKYLTCPSCLCWAVLSLFCN